MKKKMGKIMKTNIICFPQGQFATLRNRLLQDLNRETFALLLALQEQTENYRLLKIKDIRFLGEQDYESRGIAHLRPKRDFIHQCLIDVQNREDVNTIIDVHTHPFCQKQVAFSGVDDRDEEQFMRWLNTNFDDLNYASLVLSRSDYSARIWTIENGEPVPEPARVKTQTLPENWPEAGRYPLEREDITRLTDPDSGFLARSTLALGVDVIRQITQRQSIVIVGVGGLGSVIAENLVHTGFSTLHLIDPDRVESTNLNRIVGAYKTDAEAGEYKVHTVKRHLQNINPDTLITAHTAGVEEASIPDLVAGCDWIIVATDNHFSRAITQRLALRYGIPLLNTGVNITVKDGKITDMSGEVILARYGDGYCLNCLGRINPVKVAAEENRHSPLGEELVKRGYVQGETVKEPAVKTLNAMVGALAVEVLLNQYTQRQQHQPVWIYENNQGPTIYPDNESLNERHTGCFSCSL